MTSTLPDYAELHCLSNFSFLRGASHAEELVERAQALGYAALAITDECSFAGLVRAHGAAKAAGLKLIAGTEIVLDDGMKLVLLAQDRAGYGNLSAIVTLGRRRAEKGHYRLTRGDFARGIAGCLALWIAPADAPAEDGHWLSRAFPERAWLLFERHLAPDDDARLRALKRLSAQTDLPLAAAGDVHMHVRSRRPLQDMLTALRLNVPLEQAGRALFANGERHLRSRLHLAQRYPPELLAETLKIAGLCQFSLDELRYEYPEEIVPPGQTPTAYLRAEVLRGLAVRYPDGTQDKTLSQVEYELSLIAELRYEAYFLTVYDIVKFARGQRILCQGRGSAANSAVCYALGITEVDPEKSELLFERFISKERNEPPDIDVDFEHRRREEVIQYLYGKYGRARAALTATVICYRTRSALRDCGRALGIDIDRINALTSSLAWWDQRETLPARFAEAGLDPGNPRVVQWLALADQLRGFPRHLSQHVGGFVISRGRLDRLVPIENAAMEAPQHHPVGQGRHRRPQTDEGRRPRPRHAHRDPPRARTPSRNATWPASSACRTSRAKTRPTYAMISRADTIGVFQIESRAQMVDAAAPQAPLLSTISSSKSPSSAPARSRATWCIPTCAGVRVIEARSAYPSPAVESVLQRTLGVPIFQEQVMQLAVVAAGFTPGEADHLRRSMAAWKRRGGVGHFRERLIEGMRVRGYAREFAEAIFRQIEGFGEYGFPESHAASFAQLVYVSAWLKCHEPAAFLVGLLNAQPMGFYSASQLVQDARRHGVRVLAPDVAHSDWETTLEGEGLGTVRLGLSLIGGVAADAGLRIAAARPFRDVADLAQRARLDREALEALAAGGALAGLAGHRRQAAWAVAATPLRQDLLIDAPTAETTFELPSPSEGEDIVADYASLRLSLGRHPLSLLRGALAQQRYLTAADIRDFESNRPARCAGIVTGRQRPGNAQVVFVTLEDETGFVNVIVHPRLAERQRRELLASRLLGVLGVLQREGEVIHLIAKRLVDHTPLLGRLPTSSRDFH